MKPKFTSAKDLAVKEITEQWETYKSGKKKGVSTLTTSDLLVLKRQARRHGVVLK